MTEKLKLKSYLAKHLQGFLDEKHAQGYAYNTETYWIKRFDEYWFNHGYEFENLTQESLEDWLQKRSSEGKKCHATRVSVIRMFSFYLNGLGIYSYIPNLNIHYNRPIIHVLTDEEIVTLFYQIDKSVKADQRTSLEKSIILRLIYSCGLRISEACGLAVENVDLENGVLSIFNAKGHKDRLVYLAEDMRILLLDYYKSLCANFSFQQKWLFPGKNANAHISCSSTRRCFWKCWRKTSFHKTCDKDPTVHSLRHTFVVKRMNQWMLEDVDMNTMVPYLSKYLGHKDINETYYYYHFVSESARIIREKDTQSMMVIPEARRR